MTGDGLPIAYTQEEIYDTVVRLRAEIKKDKEQLSELDILFCYVSKLVDSVAETSYLGRNCIQFPSFLTCVLYVVSFQSERTLLHYRLHRASLPLRPRLLLYYRHQAGNV